MVKVINKSNNKLPEYKTEGAAGMDLRADLDRHISLKPGETKTIGTGLFIGIPEGYEGQIRSRSGLAFKHSVSVLNSPGTIDSDYRGEIKVILINLGREEFTVNNGDRIAQIVFSRYEKVEFTEVTELNDTVRGEGGLGHSGIK